MVFRLSLNISETESCVFLDKVWVELHFRGIFKDKTATFD